MGNDKWWTVVVCHLVTTSTSAMWHLECLSEDTKDEGLTLDGEVVHCCYQAIVDCCGHWAGIVMVVEERRCGLQEVSDPATMDIRSDTGHWQQLFPSFVNSKCKLMLRTPSPMFYHYSIIINGMWFDSTEHGYFEWEGGKYFCCAFDNVPGINLRLVLVKCNWTQG